MTMNTHLAKNTRVPNIKALVSTLTLAAAAFGLAGCVGQDRGTALDLEQTIAQPKFVALATASSDRDARPRAAAALPLAAGPVISVKDRRYADGFRQDVMLGGGAVRGVANGITVLAHESVGRGSEPLPLAKPTQPSITTEIATQFPGSSLQVMTRRFTNAYGPYGVAMGRGTDDVRCLYAWQWIDDQTLLARIAMTGPVSVRTRLCRAGQTFDAMAVLMNGLLLGRDATSPAAAREGATLSAIVEAPAGLGDKPITRHRPRRVKVARHHAPAHARHEAAEPQVAVEQPVAATTSSARYMAPVAPDAPVGARAETAPARAEGPKLSADLPPQAYMGPGAAPRVATTTPSVGR